MPFSGLPIVVLGGSVVTKRRLETKSRDRRSYAEHSRDGLSRTVRALRQRTRELEHALTDAQRANTELQRDTSAQETAGHERQLELDALTRLYKLGEHFFGDQSPRATLDEILDTAIAISDADFGNIQILDPESRELRVMSQRGLPQWWLDYWAKAAAGAGASGAALEHGERVIVDDVEKSPIFADTPGLDIHRKAGIRAVQSTPLMSRSGAPLGTISTHFKKAGRPSDRALRLLDLLARQAADLLDRLKAEEQLRLSEAKFSGIVSISADAIISVDESRRITLWNDGAEKIYGFSRAEAIGMPLDDLVPERLRTRYVDGFERFVKGPDVAIKMDDIDATLYGLRKGREEFPVDAAISKMEIQGQPIITIAIRDITEQKRVESEQRLLAEIGQMLGRRDYEDTLTSIVQLIVRELADVAVLYIRQDNGVIRRMRAASRPGSMWSEPLDGLRVDARPDHAAARVTMTKQPILLDVTPEALPAFAHNDEHLRALRAANVRSIMGVPLLAHDKAFGALFFKSSRRRYVETDLRLAGEIGRRTALLIENAGLHRAARRAIRARDDVLAIVAHDLRNPLGTILMEAGALMLPTPLPAHGPPEAGKSITRAANRMKRLIRDLLDVTRIESGALSLERRHVPVARVISEFVADRKALPGSPAPELHADIAENVGQVFADRDRLLQVLENLVTNAERFTGPNGRVMVGASARDGEVVFHVKDTGPGISADDLPHVFERFGPKKHTDRRGTGLGLPIVKGIVEAHGGHVWAESSLGQGSAFFFAIPRAVSGNESASATTEKPRDRDRRALPIELPE